MVTHKRVNYHEYLASREWRLKRKEVIERAENICERCANAPVENVHHRSYEHLGNEHLQELAGLCRPCHEFMSGVRNDDPAEEIIMRLIEEHGLIFDDIITADDRQYVYFVTAPTAQNKKFIVMFQSRPDSPPTYGPEMPVIIRLSDDVWAYCQRYY